jgi:hypothetical protein
MNTMPFPDGSQEVPRGLLVALPAFRLNPLNGRTAPMHVTQKPDCGARKRSLIRFALLLLDSTWANL